MNPSAPCEIPQTLPTYSVLGVRLASRYPFESSLEPARGPADVVFETVDAVPLPGDWASLQPNYDGAVPGAREDEPRVVIVVGDCHVLRYLDVIDFFVWPNRIACHVHHAPSAFAVESLLLGQVMAYWLELQGLPTLHASAVAVDGAAVAFLATSQSGKSTLAASLVQAGAAFLTDDMLPLDVGEDRTMARPAYAQMRLWPDQAEHLLGSIRAFDRVHAHTDKLSVELEAIAAGRFCSAPRPLDTIYLPQRTPGGPIAFSDVSAGEALIALISHSLMAGIVESLGMTRRRFATFARCLRHVRVRHLRYPEGIGNLPRVASAILEDGRYTRHEASG